MKKIAILTGGGDVQPLNIVIKSAKELCENYGLELIGFINGWEGILKEEYLVLNNVSFNSEIGGTILKSSRVNLKNIENAEMKILEKLNKLKIEGLIVIGGEDTLSNSLLLKKFPQVLISKTIDNDVGIINEKRITNYFTLGHPTAAEKISSFVSLKEGVRTTAYSHKRIIVVESMGMHAGWLAMSSAFGLPDFIIVPEFPLIYDSFKEKVVDRFEKNQNVIIVISEGAKWENGEYISADKEETDEFGHPKFLGAASKLRTKLKIDLKKYFDTRNVNYINPSYLYRSGKPNNLDKNAAAIFGKKAVELLMSGVDSPIFLSIKIDEKIETEEIAFSKFDNIEEFHRFIPEMFYDKEKLFPTIDYINYLSKISGFKDIDYNEYLLK